MKTRLATLGLAGLLMGMGCTRVEEGPIGWEIDEPYIPAVDRLDVSNRARLEAAPPPVRNAFLRQYPDAGITNVQLLTAANGRLIYRINFVGDDGVPGMTMYTMDGQTVTPPDLGPLLQMAPPAAPGGAPGLR